MGASSSCAAGGYNVGTASLRVSNLPAGLPSLGPVSGAFWRRCDGTGLWNATISGLSSFSLDIGSGVVTVASPVLSIDNFLGAPRLVFTGSVGAVALTVAVNSSTGAATASGVLGSAASVRSLYASLTGGSALAVAGPADLTAPVLDASLTSLALTADLLSLTVSFAATLTAFGASSDFGARLVGAKVSAGSVANATRSLTYSTAFGLSISTMNGLPAALASLGSGFALPQLVLSNDALRAPVAIAVGTKTFAFTPANGVALTASSWTLQGVSLSGVSLVFDPTSSGTSTTSISVSGSATATVAGFVSTVSFVRSPTGAISSLALSVAYSDSTYGISFAGALSFDNSTGVAAASGTLSAASFTLGGRALSLVSGSSPPTISLAGGSWSLSVPMPSISIASLPITGLTFVPTKLATGSWNVALSGAVALSGVGNAAVSITYSTPTAYSVALAVTGTSPTFPFAAAFSLVDSGSCAALSGSVSSFALKVGGETISLPTGVSAAYNTCSGAMSLSTATATSFSVSGFSCALTSLSVSRASSGGAWSGALAASTSGGIALGGDFSGTQSLAIAFSSSGISSLALAVSVSSGSAMTVAGTISITPRASCAAGGMDRATLSVNALVPTGSQSFALAGSGTFARSCEGTGAWSVSASSSAIYTVDMGSSTVTVAGLTASYSSASGTIALSGLVDNKLVVTVSGSAATRSFALSGALAAPMTVGALFKSLTGSTLAGPISELASPVKNAVVEALVVAVAVQGSTLTLSFGAKVSQIFGASSIGVAAQLAKGASGPSGTLGLSMDFGAMKQLPGSLKLLASLITVPSLNIGFGTPASGASMLTRLTMPSALASSSYPALYPTTGLAISASVDLTGSSGMGSFIRAIPTGSSLRTMLSALGSSTAVTVSFASVDSMALSVSLLSGSNSMTMGGSGNVAFTGLVLQQSISPTTLAVAITASLSAKVGRGANAATLIGAVELALQVSEGVASLKASAALGIAGSTVWRSPMGMGSNVAILM